MGMNYALNYNNSSFLSKKRERKDNLPLLKEWEKGTSRR